MIRRVATAVLWLFAVAWAGNFLSAYMGVPQAVSGIVATATALFVGIDPLHRIWVAAATSASASLREATPAVSHVPSRI